MKRKEWGGRMKLRNERDSKKWKMERVEKGKNIEREEAKEVGGKRILRKEE